MVLIPIMFEIEKVEIINRAKIEIYDFPAIYIFSIENGRGADEFSKIII